MGKITYDLNHIEIPNLLAIAIVLVAAIIITRFTRWLIKKSFHTASEKLNVDPTRYKFFMNAASLIIWMVTIGIIVLLIPKLRALAITLFAGAGILVAILGFAAQQAFSNIIGGIFVVIFRPFRVGDMIKVGNLEYGIVDDITLRHTVITSFENKKIIIPNAVINSETIVNDSIDDIKVCRYVEVSISYESDVDTATAIVQEEAGKHPECIDVRTQEEMDGGINKVVVRLIRFEESGVRLRAYVWTKNPYQAIQLHSDINKAIKKRFQAEGIEIPFPHRTIVYKNSPTPTPSAHD